MHAFDPTPRSVKWLKEQKLPNNFFFYPYGLADYDGLMEFYPPSNPNHVSFSIYKHGSYAKKSKMVKAQVYRLKTIMEMLGHSRIDLLKMDIEGAEYAVIRDIIDSNIEIGQLIVEFHHRWKNVGAAKTREAVIILNKNRFKIFNITATGEEYSFLKV